MKNVLIIMGNPETKSFSGALADAYTKGAKAAGHEVKRLDLGEMDFDPVLRRPDGKYPQMEPCLLEAQSMISEADHLVFIYPNWWGVMPAILKGFIDRVFLDGFAFEFSGRSPIPIGLLNGKTARLIVTMDTPGWFYRLVYKMPGHNAMKRSILNFCGIKDVRITEFAVIKKSSREKRKVWLKKTEILGRSI